MGNMHIIPTQKDLYQFDQKSEPIKGFVGITETDPSWEHGCPFCNGCGEPFDAVFLRKHHCRICGLTYCTRCSPKRHLLSGARGCGKCLSEVIMKDKDRMVEEHKRIAASSPRTRVPPSVGTPASDSSTTIVQQQSTDEATAEDSDRPPSRASTDEASPREKHVTPVATPSS